VLFYCFIFDRSFSQYKMPRTPEQYQKIREEKRKQIMEAALELFSNEGYHGTSISKIAKAAGISKGLLYNYFKSKEELVTSIMNKGMEILTDFLDPNKDGILTDEEFEFFVRKSFETLKENTSYWRLYFSLIMQAEVYELVMEKYQEVLGNTMELLIVYFKKQGAKEPVSEATLFGSIMDGVSLTYILNPAGTDLETIQQSIINKFRKNTE